MSEMTPAEELRIEQQSRAAVEWLRSPAGQAAMRAAKEANQPFIDSLKKARQIPWEKLHEPFTI
jgi:hypothetical protein